MTKKIFLILIICQIKTISKKKREKIMKLYVIRHGETEMGKNEIIATEDEPLNKFGMN